MPERALNGDSAESIVFALCHEVGNLLAAVRLQASLLDDGLGPRDLAAASVEVDDLSARASTLLAQVRPLLSRSTGSGGLDPAVALSGLQRTLDDQGTRGVRLLIEADDGLPEVPIAGDVLHAILHGHVWAAIEATRPRGTVRVRAFRDGDWAVFRIDDDATEEEPLESWPELARRGRPLLCASAHEILARRGGRVVASRVDGHARIELRLPVA